MLRFVILFAISATLLAACASVTPGVSPGDAPLATLSSDLARQGTLMAHLSTAAPLANATIAALQTEVARNSTMVSYSSIEFCRSGGIVGLDDLLAIDAKGHAQLTRRTGKSEFDLAPSDFARLAALLRDANFKSIPEDSQRKPYLVPDEISYVIVYQGRTVKTSDTAIPEKLQPAIQMMNAILDAQSR